MINSTKISAAFLATILVAGTITAIYPSFVIGAEAQSETHYGVDSYKQSYGKDSYKSKDSNSSAIVKKVKCNNINVNINGLELDGLPPFLSTLLASDGQADYYGDARYYGNSEKSYGDGQKGSENDFKFVCINNNNNTVIVGEETPALQVEECAEADEIEACFANAEFMGEGGFPEFVAALESGITVEINGQEITLRSFEDICLAFEGLTTYAQLEEAVDNILDEVPQVDVGEGFFAVVDCIAEAIGIPIPPR